MKNPRRADVRASVPCPSCLAAVGAACLGRNGQERVSNHKERSELYLASLEPQAPAEPVDPATMPYGDYLLTPEWRARRRDAIGRAGGMCQLCCSPRSLHVHHRTYARRGDEHPSDLTVLCEECHDLFHEHRRLTNLEGSVSYGAFVHAAIEERQRATVGRTVTIGDDVWRFQAVKYANDNFQDYPENAVIDSLRILRWPDRPVTVRDVQSKLLLMGLTSDRRRVA